MPSKAMTPQEFHKRLPELFDSGSRVIMLDGPGDSIVNAYVHDASPVEKVLRALRSLIAELSHLHLTVRIELLQGR
jgi:hypothetical protein